MSIIQEALKKAQVDIKDTKVAQGSDKVAAPVPPATEACNPTVGASRPVTSQPIPTAGPRSFTASTKRPTGGPGHDPKAVAILLILLIVTACLAANQLFPGRNAAMKPAAGQNAGSGEIQSAAGNKPLAPLQSIVFRPTEEKKPAYPEFELNGIMYLEGGPRAIINDSMVEIGDVVNGAKVIKIEKRGVALQYNDTEIALKLK